jgi:cell division protein FtsQ
MNAVANTVFVLAGWRCGGRSCGWLRSPAVSGAHIQLEGDLARNSVPTIRANAAPRWPATSSASTWRGARAFETVPWVRRAVVRRVWPDRLGCAWKSTAPLALWADDGNDRLVNSQGEVFEANVGDVEDDQPAHALSGPEGSAAQMLALAPAAAAGVRRLDADPAAARAVGPRLVAAAARQRRHAGTGPRQRGRTGGAHERFVRTLPRSARAGSAPLLYADLRHTDGYAVRLRGVSTTRAARGAGTPAANTN